VEVEEEERGDEGGFPLVEELDEHHPLLYLGSWPSQSHFTPLLCLFFFPVGRTSRSLVPLGQKCILLQTISNNKLFIWVL
jgi:hypothetical protein